jgi:hypothetical protein
MHLINSSPDTILARRRGWESGNATGLTQIGLTKLVRNAVVVAFSSDGSKVAQLRVQKGTSDVRIFPSLPANLLFTYTPNALSPESTVRAPWQLNPALLQDLW